MKCYACGEKISTKAKFCEGCGKVQPLKTKKKKSLDSWKPIIAGIAIAVLTVAIGISAAIFLTSCLVEL